MRGACPDRPDPSPNWRLSLTNDPAMQSPMSDTVNLVTGEATDKVLEDIEKLGNTLDRVRAGIGRIIFGQEEVVEQTLVTLLSGGHVLLIGVPLRDERPVVSAVN